MLPFRCFFWWWAEYPEARRPEPRRERTGAEKIAPANDTPTSQLSPKSQDNLRRDTGGPPERATRNRSRCGKTKKVRKQKGKLVHVDPTRNFLKPSKTACHTQNLLSEKGGGGGEKGENITGVKPARKRCCAARRPPPFASFCLFLLIFCPIFL